jgi:hypothetical protein
MATPQFPKPMKTESRRVFTCGFALTESELRRLHEVLVQQIKRTPAGDVFHATYEVKYRNGSVSHPASVDEVLTQENFGSASIVRLKMGVEGNGEEKTANQISTEFINADKEGGTSVDSVKYTVLGDDRDWVFVTSSQLDERIGKVKLFVPNQLFARRSRLLAVVFPILFLLMLFGSFAPVGSRAKETRTKLDKIEAEWKRGAIKDTTEALIRIEKFKVEREARIADAFWPLSPFLLFFALMLLGYVYVYFSPPYNFLWGDYVSVYEKRRSRGRFLLVGVLLTSALGIAVNFISKRIF